MLPGSVPSGLRACFSPEAREVRRLIRSANYASLATLDRRSGSPFASLVQVSAMPDARPCFLISGLAQHTRNLVADSRASILIDCRSETEPMTTSRVTLSGRAQRLSGELEAIARRRFLAVHTDARAYAGFADFMFWCLAVEQAHLVAGFGRIRQVPGAYVGLAGLDLGDMSVLANGEEPPGLSQLQHHLAVRDDKPISICGWDCEGLNVVTTGGNVRLSFDEPCFKQSSAIAAADFALHQFTQG